MIRKRRLLIVSSLFLVFQLGECAVLEVIQQNNNDSDDATNVNTNKVVVNNDHVNTEQSSLSSSLMTTEITNKKQQPLSLRGRGNNDKNNQRHTRQVTYSSYTFCGVSCFSDQNCQGATDGCNFCSTSTSTCYEPQPPQNLCGLSCETNNDCVGDNGCSICNEYSVCSDSPSESRTCINSETAFQAALDDDTVKVVTLCGNTQLVLEEGDTAFTATRSAFTINCASGGNNCFILRKAGYGRLLEMDGGSINIVGLRFDKGDTVTDASDITQDIGSNGDGGAIYIVGGNNNIENCIFRDNLAKGNGGAVNWNNGNVKTSKGFNNVGADGSCNGVYSRSTQTCDDTVNSGTNDQCGAYCSNSDANWACDRVNGVCGVCDLTTNTCKQNASTPTPPAPSTPTAPVPTPTVPTPSTPSPAPVVPVPSAPGEVDEICGTSCSVSADCASSTTCNVCELSSVGIGLCVPEGARTTCVSTEQTLREALADPLQPVVQICTSTTIEVTSVLQISQSYKTLTCEGNERTCTLIRPSWVYDNFRILRASGNNVRLAYLTIQNGFSGGDGGGVLLERDDNIILNVEFVGNHAERGGALAMGTGVVISSTFAGNSAKQCTNTYVISSGLCQN